MCHIQRKVYLGYEKACRCCIGVLLLDDQFSPLSIISVILA